jgi:argininosuccinate lyase
MLKHSHFRYDNIERQMDKGFLNATDVAESLVQQGIPFRTAHELVGVLVKYCENNGLKLEEIKQEDLPNIDHRLKNIELKDLDNYSCIMRRNSFGGTSPVEVQRQINVGREFLEADFTMNC